MNALRIAIAQINSTVGDFTANLGRILAAADWAHANGVDLLITPELALSGYPPEDWVFHRHYLDAEAAAYAALVEQSQRWPGLCLAVGRLLAGPTATAGVAKPYNALCLLAQQKTLGDYKKRRLPNEAVFDEQRHFVAGNAAYVSEHRGLKIAWAICEDIWQDGVFDDLAGRVDALISLNASPMHLGKIGERSARLNTLSRQLDAAIVYVNAVGGQDELVFDGASLAVTAKGEGVLSCPSFVSGYATIDLGVGGTLDSPTWQAEAASAPALTLPAQVIIPSPHTLLAAPLPAAEEAYRALVLAVADYVGKNRFPGVLLGLSGGVDSALTLTIAVDALGADAVEALMLPSPYTASMSIDDSRQLVAKLGCRYREVPIEPLMVAYRSLLEPLLPTPVPASDVTWENIQARIRGAILMAVSNRRGKLLLTTGNKSEMAVGYATLYGDMAGGFAVLKDVLKTVVYDMAAYRNSLAAVIPERILTRPPSAELRPDQTDQDSLPDYALLDGIISAILEEHRSSDELIAAGTPPEAVRKSARLLALAEYKRRQSAIGPRITRRAFGRDWRYPVSHRFGF